MSLFKTLFKMSDVDLSFQVIYCESKFMLEDFRVEVANVDGIIWYTVV